MDVGRHCDTCGQLDFLPFDCHRCGHVFCMDHREHTCLATASPVPPKAVPPASKTSTVKPVTKTTQPARLAEQKHSVPPIKQAQQPKKTEGLSERTRAVLERLNLTRRPTKPAPANAIATLKAQAKGDSVVPISDRVYVWLYRPETEYKNELSGTLEKRPAKKVAHYFGRNQKVGQALDSASKVLGTSVNGRDAYIQLEATGARLAGSDRLGDCIESGATLVLAGLA